ncbi:MarR family transcriptional regulator [Curtobacterium sp. MCPF17_011]|uniref:MarR family winged helix-turn-helix transcriptional regulator n=1 Tax=Curtobacterium sp. MCPF17_011 TaxID=2175652 RepID=UPI000DA855A7|nr:MarR family transcriptional regulator [Curtobacterium sp. MCPF17_011]PZF09978.1 MarR family transcriptional regulator [Curtobacterium sp. MCPF17_011]
MTSSNRPPAALRRLVSWQAGRVATIGARLTAQQMPLEARSDYAVLASLDEYGPLSQADLGRVLGLDRNNVNGIVVRLDTGGEVTRSPDPSDRRRNVVTITRDGRSRFQELQEHAAVVQQELLASLDEVDRDTLVRLLDTVLAHHPSQPA